MSDKPTYLTNDDQAQFERLYAKYVLWNKRSRDYIAVAELGGGQTPLREHAELFTKQDALDYVHKQRHNNPRERFLIMDANRVGGIVTGD